MSGSGLERDARVVNRGSDDHQVPLIMARAPSTPTAGGYRSWSGLLGRIGRVGQQ